MLLKLSSTVNNKNSNYKPNILLFAALACSLIVAGCASRSDTAPVTDYTNSGNSSNSGAVVVSGSGATYVVKPGDTLYSIARGNNMQVNDLASLNNVTDSSQLSVGQILRLDNQSQVAGLNPTNDNASTTQNNTQFADSKPEDKKPTSAQETTNKEKTDVSPAADAKVIDWQWPITGNIIQGFNASTKGVDIEGAIGDPVKAAANGKVMYSGNGVRGLGNLLLVMHEDGYISAYAHNSELLAKKDQTVKKGEKIATVGQSDTDSPRLHFEIRRRGTPVNPLSYLPKR